jgi:hypothetical protein
VECIDQVSVRVWGGGGEFRAVFREAVAEIIIIDAREQRFNL